MEKQQSHQGSCLCGEIQFEFAGKAKVISHCHCRMCQKQHGAAYASYIGIRSGNISYIKGQDFLQSYASSEGTERTFCRQCGSSLTWQSKAHPEYLSIAAASVDTPLQATEFKDIFLESRQNWPHQE